MTPVAGDEPSCAPASIASSGAAPASSPSTACWPASTPAPRHHGPSCSWFSTGPRSRSTPTARTTTSAAHSRVALPRRCSSARSPSARSPAPRLRGCGDPAPPHDERGRPRRPRRLPRPDEDLPQARPLVRRPSRRPPRRFPTLRPSCRYQSWSAPAPPPDRPAFAAVTTNAAKSMTWRRKFGCGGRIRTYDLQVMSRASALSLNFE